MRPGHWGNKKRENFSFFHFLFASVCDGNAHRHAKSARLTCWLQRFFLFLERRHVFSIGIRTHQITPPSFKRISSSEFMNYFFSFFHWFHESKHILYVSM